MSTVLRGHVHREGQASRYVDRGDRQRPGHNNMDKIVEPHREVLLKAHLALMEIQNQMRKQP